MLFMSYLFVWYLIVSIPDLCTLTYFVVFMLSRLFITALWSHAGKGLTSWLLFVMFNYVFVIFLRGILGQVWNSIPDLCLISFFISLWSIVTANLISEGSNRSAHFIIKLKYPLSTGIFDISLF